MRSETVRGAAVVVGIAGVLALSGCGSSSNETAKTVTVTPSATTVTATPPVTTHRDTGGTASSSGASSVKPTDDQKVATKKGIMPDVVCMNLQKAQDTIQKHGVFYSRSEDATGKGRHQVWDRNWIVVAQRPAPGAQFGEGDAVLSVVKTGEPNNCPHG